MEIFIIVVLFIIALIALAGNISLGAAIFTGTLDTFLASDDAFSIAIALIADFIIICVIVDKCYKPISSSFLAAYKGINKRVKIKKDSKILNPQIQEEQYCVARLNELRNQKIDIKSTIQCTHFCQLLEELGYKEQISDCISAVNQKNNCLIEIGNIEKKILETADIYKEMGNADKCKYYLDIAKSNNSPEDMEELEAECENLILLKDKERKEIKKWGIIFSAVILSVVTFFVAAFIKNTPYRTLRSHMDNETLTAEMAENSYYYYFHSDKGYKLLASMLTKFHENDDIEKALWLLCIQPDCINGLEVCISNSFADWVVDYARKNGTSKTDSDGDTTYYVDSYEISISSIYDYYHDFYIDDGTNRSYIEVKNKFEDDPVPTIH